MSVCFAFCVLSCRDLCFGLIIRPQKSYRVWCVTECNRKASKTRRSFLTTDSCTTKKTAYFRHLVTVYCEEFTIYIFSVLNISSINHGVHKWQYLYNAGSGTRVLRSLSRSGTSYTGVRWMILFPKMRCSCKYTQ